MLRSEYDLLAGEFAALPVDSDTYGTIHGDFELDNLVWRGSTAAILDFDDSAHLWYAADIALATRDLFADEAGAGMSVTRGMDDPRFQAFMEGYREQRALDEDSLARVPLFLRVACLLEYARLVRALDLAEGAQQADWLVALRENRRAAPPCIVRWWNHPLDERLVSRPWSSPHASQVLHSRSLGAHTFSFLFTLCPLLL